MEVPCKIVHIEKDLSGSAYLIDVDSKTIAKFPFDKSPPTVYGGYPDVCSCPSFTHRQDCKHIAMWREWYDGTVFRDPTPVERSEALEAFTPLARRGARFSSFELTADGRVLSVRAVCDFPEFARLCLVGKVGNTVIRVYGPGTSPPSR